MIGCEDYPITMMSSASNLDKTTPLIDSLTEICYNFDIENKVTYQDSSDHASFCNDGFDSLTLSHSNTSNIHTPNDTVDKISTKGISQVYEVVECKNIKLLSLILYFPISFYNLLSIRNTMLHHKSPDYLYRIV